MLILTYNPFCCYFTRVYLLVEGIDYLEEFQRGLLHVTRGIKIFAMTSLHCDLNAGEGPSEYLIARVSIYHNSAPELTYERDCLHMTASKD